MGKKRIKLIDDSVQEKQPRQKEKRPSAELLEKKESLETKKKLKTPSFASSSAKAKEDKKVSKARQKDKESLKIKSGKAEEARLADMGEKALIELEEREAKEKESSVPSVLPASKAGLQKKHLKPEKSPKTPKPPKTHSKRYQNIKKNVKSNIKYSLGEALELVIKGATASFDESVEAHLVLKEKLTSSVDLPHGTGKKQRVAIADDKILAQIQKGKIDFDILISSPAMMPKLARVAKILGPKGLMPNPKMGTISDKLEELKKKLEGGQIRFKTEPKASLLHFSIGKVSFGKEKLAENLKTFLTAVGNNKIIKASICSTMGPGIRLDLEEVCRKN